MYILPETNGNFFQYPTQIWNRNIKNLLCLKPSYLTLVLPDHSLYLPCGIK